MSAPEGEVRAFVCAYCASVGVAMRFCSVCRSTTYCSVACQKKDWKRHQLTCGQQPEAGSESTTTNPEPQANSQTGNAAAAAVSAASDATSTTSTTTNTDPVQQLTHNENVSETSTTQQDGLFSATNMILAGAVSITLAVAGWFAYSYLGSPSEQRRPGNQQPKGRKPPQRR